MPSPSWRPPPGCSSRCLPQIGGARGAAALHGAVGDFLQPVLPGGDPVRHHSLDHGAAMSTLGRRLSLASGAAIAAAAVLPPLSTFGAQLFAVHMAQHLLLIAAAAPLLALGARLSPPPRDVVAALRRDVPVLALPAAFQWAAQNRATDLLELASILATAFAFWSAALRARPAEPWRARAAGDDGSGGDRPARRDHALRAARHLRHAGRKCAGVRDHAARGPADCGAF